MFPKKITGLFLFLLMACYSQNSIAQEVNSIDKKGTITKIKNNKVTTATTAPNTPVDGDVWFDNTDPSQIIKKIWGGNLWITDEVTGTTGSVFFAGANSFLTENNSEFFWDNVNNRLIIGATSGTNKLNVNGTTGTLGLFNSNGTALLPSYSFTSNNSTGFYLPNTNQLGFVTAGTEVIRIDNSQRVGIGTITPTEKLDVLGKIRLRTGALNNGVLVSDATGVGTWTDINTLLPNSWILGGNASSNATLGSTDSELPLIAFGTTGIILKNNANAVIGLKPDHNITDNSNSNLSITTSTLGRGQKIGDDNTENIYIGTINDANSNSHNLTLASTLEMFTKNTNVILNQDSGSNFLNNKNLIINQDSGSNFENNQFIIANGNKHVDWSGNDRILASGENLSLKDVHLAEVFGTGSISSEKNALILIEGGSINTRLSHNAENSFINSLGGNVGIGTNSPNAQFHTTGTLRFQGLGSNTIDTNILTLNASGDVTTRTISNILNNNAITSINGLSNSVQTFGIGTAGTNFNIVSNATTHTFNFPNASASNRGLLTSIDWNIFNNKQNTVALTVTGNNGASTFDASTGALNIPTYTLAGLGGISLTGLSASAPIIYNNTTGAFSISQANTSTNGFLSSTDWNTFNNKLSSTLAPGNVFVGNASNEATAVAISGDATLSNTGALTIANNAITSAKILDGTIATGDISAGGVTSTNILDGTIATADLANSAITYEKIQNVAASRLLGNPTGTAAAPSEITLGNGLSFTGTTLNAVSTIAELVETAGTQTYNTAAGFVVLNLSGTNILDTGYSQSGGEVTVANAGRYKVTYRISARTNTNSQVSGEYKLQIAGVDVPGSFGYAIHRNTTDPRATVTVTKIVTLTANQVVRVQGRVNNTATRTLQLVAGGSSLLIERL